MAEFGGRTVIVTGASGGLGAAVVAAFAAAGADVIGVARHIPPAAEPSAGPAATVRYVAVDLADDDAVGAFFDDCGTPWAVAHTVGGYAPSTPLADLDVAELTGQLTLNLTTSALVVKHALRRMTGAGGGRVVLTSSRSATVTAGAGFPYSVSKLGVLHLTRMAAEQTAGTGVTVNCVVPSIIDTAANRTAMPRADHAAWPKPADIARAYLFLADPASGVVNGATITV